MANTFAPFGFRSFGRFEGGAPTAGLTRFYLASSDTNLYFTGDVVQLSTGVGSPAGYITLPASGSTPTMPILGVFAGCEYYSPSVGRVVWSSFFPGNLGNSSSPANAYVISDPDQLFLVQGTTTATLGTSVIGYNVGFTSTGALGTQNLGNQTMGISNIALQSTSVSSATTLPFRIVDSTSNYQPPGVNGTDGTTPGAIMVVQFNNQYRRTITGVSN